LWIFIFSIQNMNSKDKMIQFRTKVPRVRFINIRIPKQEFVPKPNEFQLFQNPKTSQFADLIDIISTELYRGRQPWIVQHLKSEVFKRECVEYSRIEAEEYSVIRDQRIREIVVAFYDRQLPKDLITFFFKQTIIPMWEDERDINAACFYHLALMKPRFFMPKFLIKLRKTKLYWQLMEIRRKIYVNSTVLVNHRGEAYQPEYYYQVNTTAVYVKFLRSTGILEEFAGQEMNAWRAHYCSDPESDEFIRLLWEIPKRNETPNVSFHLDSN
jgi:hypothetical protein